MATRTITTDATGTQTTMPDFAAVEVVAKGEGESARAAREAARTTATELAAGLQETPVPVEQIHTVELQVVETAETFEMDSDAPYGATERLRVECPPEAVVDVVTAATDAGASAPTAQFDVHAERREQLREDALAAAMDAARRKAERIAAAEDLKLGGLREAATTAEDTGYDGLVDQALDQSSDSDLAITPIAVSAAVEAVYDVTASPDGDE